MLQMKTAILLRFAWYGCHTAGERSCPSDAAAWRRDLPSFGPAGRDGRSIRVLGKEEKKMTTLQAFVFDAYGTLFDVHSVVDAAEGAFPGKGKALSQLWRSKQLEYTWLRSLYGSYQDFWRITQDALVFACQSLNLDCPPVLQERLMDGYLQLDTFPEVVRALDSLSGKTLAILSNGSPYMLSEVVAHAGLSGRFTQVISVDEVRIYKPSPRVYELAPIKLGIAKEKIGFVTSNYFDVAGAKAFGFHVYWANRTSAPADHLDLAPDEVVSLLTDIQP